MTSAGRGPPASFTCSRGSTRRDHVDRTFLARNAPAVQPRRFPVRELRYRVLPAPGRLPLLREAPPVPRAPRTVPAVGGWGGGDVHHRPRRGRGVRDAGPVRSRDRSDPGRTDAHRPGGGHGPARGPDRSQGPGDVPEAPVRGRRRVIHYGYKFTPAEPSAPRPAPAAEDQIPTPAPSEPRGARA